MSSLSRTGQRNKSLTLVVDLAITIRIRLAHHFIRLCVSQLIAYDLH